jgi:hypothetical protein
MQAVVNVNAKRRADEIEKVFNTSAPTPAPLYHINTPKKPKESLPP